jgi:hypothetical protein
VSAIDDANADNNVCADPDATFLSSMIGRINRAEESFSHSRPRVDAGSGNDAHPPQSEQSKN